MIRKKIDDDESGLPIGVNFFTATQVKTQDEWKRFTEEYRILESIYNKSKPSPSYQTVPFNKWDGIWCFFILTVIILLTLLAIFIINSFGWEALWDLISRHI